MRKEIEQYINESYDSIQEYPWDDAPTYSTFKHKDNKKWFALIMNIPFKYLKIEKDECVDVINLKNIPELIGSLRLEPGILPAYHMNKEHWITVLLDGTVPKQRVCELIDISYEMTRQKGKRK